MTRTVYYAASTLNGHLATDDDSLTWLLDIPQDEVAPLSDAFTSRIGVLVEGAATYEWVVRENDLLDHPERWTQFYGDRPAFVFTTRRLPAVDGADIRFVSGDVTRHLPAITAAAGEGDIWIVGGGELAGEFLDAGRLDEIVVTVAPALLRSGKPLLPRDLDWRRLELVRVRQAGRFVELSYAVHPEGGLESRTS